VAPIPTETLSDYMPKDRILILSEMRFEAVVFLPAAPEGSGAFHEE